MAEPNAKPKKEEFRRVRGPDLPSETTEATVSLMLTVFSPPYLEEEGARLARRHPALSGVVFSTSGTTGTPKWVLHSQDGLDWCADRVNAHFGCHQNDVWGLALPVFHVGGYNVMHRARRAKGALARFLKKWDAASFTSWVRAEGVTITSLVPTQVFDLVRAHQPCPPSLRCVIIGGDRLAEELCEQARELGWPLALSYGMTETAGMVAVSDFRSTELFPLSGWQVTATVERLLEVSGRGLFKGYLTPSEFSPCTGKFSTTDTVTISPNSEITIGGRKDEQVKVMGELVDLGQLRKKIAALFLENLTTVISLPDERRGRQLIVVIEGLLPTKALHLLTEFNDHLPPFSRLRGLLNPSSLPKTPLGKIDYASLTKLSENRQHSLLPLS